MVRWAQLFVTKIAFRLRLWMWMCHEMPSRAETYVKLSFWRNRWDIGGFGDWKMVKFIFDKLYRRQTGRSYYLRCSIKHWRHCEEHWSISLDKFIGQLTRVKEIPFHIYPNIAGANFIYCFRIAIQFQWNDFALQFKFKIHCIHYIL